MKKINRSFSSALLFVLIFSFLNVCMFVSSVHAEETDVDMGCGNMSTDSEVYFQIKAKNNTMPKEWDCCQDHGRIFQTFINIREANDHGLITAPLAIIDNDLTFIPRQIISEYFIQDDSPPPEFIAQRSVVMID